MNLAQKLILYALVVALLPVGATGFTLIRLGEDALRARIREHQTSVATALAAKVTQAVEDLADRLSTIMQVVDVGALSYDERLGLARLLYQQSADISATQLLDGRGKPLGEAVFLSRETEQPGSLSDHPRSDEAKMRAFREHVPGGEVIAAERPLLGAVYYGDAGEARLAMRVPCCADGQGRAQASAAVEIGVRRDLLKMQGIETGEQATVFIVDGAGRVIAHPRHGAGDDLAGHPGVRSALAAGAQGSLRYRIGEATSLGAYAPVGDLGWRLIVEQPEAIAFAAAHTMRRRTLGWILGTALLVVLTAVFFTGGIRRALARLVDGARAFGAGELSRRIGLARSDEIGELASTMDTMAGELQQSLGELAEWSRTLEAKVDERTAELQEAQAQLLTQSKLVAIGQLGAGVAHEVNNPLSGILGYAQLLKRKHPEGDPEHESLKKIEEAAKRCKDITTNLLRFSERGLSGRGPVDINDLVREVLRIVAASLDDAKVQCEFAAGEALPQITADAGQLTVVLVNLIHNARNAMPDGGCITISSEAAADGVRVMVKDEGHGIAEENLPRIFDPFFTTKNVWTSVGLGLSVAYRVVNDHGGRLEVSSREGEGSRFLIYLPTTPPDAQTSDLSMERPRFLRGN